MVKGGKKEMEEILEEPEEKKPSDKGFLTLFIIMIPSLVLAMASAISSPIIRISIQTVLLFLQLVVVKSFIDDYQNLRGY